MTNMTEILRSDIFDIITDNNIPWDEFKDSVVLVTGATGLVGSAIVRTLAEISKTLELNIRIMGHGRNKKRAEAITQEHDIDFICGDIRCPSHFAAIPDRLDFVFHCASVTKSYKMTQSPVDVLSTAIEGTKNIFELLKENSCKSFIYLSSMEVYGQTELKEIVETDLGYLDLFDPRSSYPESKRTCEMMCAAYAKQYGLPVKIARLAQTFGAGTPKEDTRVFAQFARSAIANNDIKLHTEGKSRGNYCYIADTVRGLLTVLLKGKNGEAYNLANPDASVTIREMAELIANDICSGNIKVVVNVPEDIGICCYAPDTGYVLNADKLKALGWYPKYGLAEMYKRLMADWEKSGIYNGF